MFALWLLRPRFAELHGLQSGWMLRIESLPPKQIGLM
jgi:hypothetical protein